MRRVLVVIALLALIPFGIVVSEGQGISTGGFPARPTFQAVTVNALGFVGTCGVSVSGASLCIPTSNGSHWSAVINGNSTAGSSNGLVVDAGTNSSDNPLIVRNAAASSTYFSIDGAGNITAPNAASASFLGFKYPKMSYAHITTTATPSCTVDAAFQSNNVTSCTRVGVGSGTITFTTSYANPPICTASGADSSNFRVVWGVIGTTNTSAFNIASQAGGATDDSIEITCVGF